MKFSLLHILFAVKKKKKKKNHRPQVGQSSSPPIVCTPPPFVGAWPQWPRLAGGASPSPSPSAAAPAGAETAACGSWPALLSAGPKSAVSPAPGARSLCGGRAGRPALSARPAVAQCDCPAVI